MVVVTITSICTTSSRCLARDRHLKQVEILHIFQLLFHCVGAAQFNLLWCVWCICDCFLSCHCKLKPVRKASVCQLAQEALLLYSQGPAPRGHAHEWPLPSAWAAPSAHFQRTDFSRPCDLSRLGHKNQDSVYPSHAGSSPVQRPMGQELVSSASSHQGPEAYRK